ncbi:hypothetical protein PT2222_20123 [Paraburkholderia tropica]
MIERLRVAAPIRPPRQRIVQIEAFARAASGFIRVTEQIRIVEQRVGMQRGKQHVVAIVEDRLRAVAVVIVDVENRHAPCALREPVRGGERRVVEVAVAAHHVAARVMAGRAAQRERGLCAVVHALRAREREIRRLLDRVPGARRDRRARVHRIEAELAVDAVRSAVAAQTARGPDGRQRVVRAAQRGPFSPRAVQEVEIRIAVHAAQRVDAERIGRDRLVETGFGQPRAHDIDALRHFETGLEFAVDQFATAVMQAMALAEDGQHAGLPS